MLKMSSLENLKPWKPGQSGNPAGRKKKQKTMSTILREYMECKLDFKDPYTGKTGKKKTSEIIILKLIQKAIVSNDRNAMNDIINMLDGAARNEESITPLQINLTVDADKSN
jgi:hypothetical protein